MGGIKRKPKQGEGTTRDAAAMLPSAIHADHRRNYSRSLQTITPPELADYLPHGCCFTLAEIEERLASFMQHGQISDVSIYLTSTCNAFLVDGYLRHAAFLLAEVRGVLGDIPKSGGKIRCSYVTEPKNQNDWLALAARNFEENTAVKSLSPIDKAMYAKRLTDPVTGGGFGLSNDDAAQRLGLTNARQLLRYLRLLGLAPDVLAEVHAGSVSMSQALSASTKTGQAGSPGPRSSFSVRKIRRAVEMCKVDPPPNHTLTPDEQVMLVSMIAGEVFDLDKIPKSVKAWATWLQPEPAPRGEPKPSTKKAPPKRGKAAATD